jgi:hypothetical protein
MRWLMATGSDWERLRSAALELVSAQEAMDALHAEVDIANDDEGIGIIVTRRFANAGIRRDRALAAIRAALVAVEPHASTDGTKPDTVREKAKAAQAEPRPASRRSQ